MNSRSDVDEDLTENDPFPFRGQREDEDELSVVTAVKRPNPPKSAPPQTNTARIDRRRAHRTPRVRAIRVHRANGASATVALREDHRYTFGRTDEATIVFDENRVSRLHGVLKYDDGRWVYTDLDSSNGSFVAKSDDLRRHFAGPDSDDNELAARGVSAHETVPVTAGDALVLGTRKCWVELLERVPEGAVDSDVSTVTVLSAAARAFEENLSVAARTPLPVFLLGPSGAGKTHAAGVIHQRRRASGPFVVINCARLPHDPVQLHSELLGHKKGAFTGADRERRGKLVAADGGTLFLDEVESLPEVAQGFLLDVLEKTGDLSPLGADPGAVPPGTGPVFKLISASKKPLNTSGLRKDLVQRLAAGHTWRIPTLDERREDIPGLIRVFLDELATKSDLDARITDDAIRFACAQSWPGQIRELQNTIHTVVHAAAARAAHDGEPARRLTIRVADLERYLLDRLTAFDGPTVVVQAEATSRGTALGSVLPQLVAPAPKKARQLTAADVRAALEASGGNISQAAQRLGIARNTLKGKMRKFGLAGGG